MAVNENGNLLDDAGNVVVDHVWGNMPMQPNDVREENAADGVTDPLLDPALDNHNVAYTGWNGYPLYTPNSPGAEGAGYIVVPNVIGQTLTNATDILEDDGLVVTVATAAANVRKAITRFNATSATVATVYTTSASTNYPVGSKITIRDGVDDPGSSDVNVPIYAYGTWTVTAADSSSLIISGSGFTVANTTGINEIDTIEGVAGTVKTQSVAAGANEIEVGDAITITAYATATAS
jgi:hypothetical protein